MTYLQVAQDTAHKAGEIMIQYFGIDKKTEFKSDHSPVTIADKEVNNMVIRELKKHFPDHGILGEEESNYNEEQEYIWVCDPIDGTIPYSLGIPTNVFSLALTHHGSSILGVIYDPYMKRMVWAEEGKGAWCNGERIRVNNNSLEHEVIHVSLNKTDLTGLKKELTSTHTRALVYASTLYFSMLIACGSIAGQYFTYENPWDAASAKIIIEEAGGKMTDLFGNEQRYDRPIKGYIASNGKIHDQLLELAQKYISLKP